MEQQTSTVPPFFLHSTEEPYDLPSHPQNPRLPRCAAVSTPKSLRVCRSGSGPDCLQMLASPPAKHLAARHH